MAANPAVEKVRRLIALTNSPEREEARTSATLACQLINKYGLHVVADLPRIVPPPPPAAPATRATDTMSRPRVIRSRYESTCIECKLTIAVGEPCAWLKGRGVWDLECYREVWP